METKYGLLKRISNMEWHGNGILKECQVDEEIILNTPAGRLIPKYSNEEVRSKYIKSLAFYDNGNMKKIALQKQSQVDTPIGPLLAELVTFYKNGNVNRIFPLNGKITGYWTEENEFDLAVPILIKLPFTEFEKKLIGIQFYETGDIKSITLWPRELLKIQLSSMVYGIRYGLSLYLSGNIKSLEPAYPVRVKTPIGEITAFDVNASGINGDDNSLKFNEDGSVKSLLCSTDTLKLTDYKGKTHLIKPGLRPSMISDNSMEIIPLSVEFLRNNIILRNAEETTFDIKECKIEVLFNSFVPISSCSSCADCDGCK